MDLKDIMKSINKRYENKKLCESFKMYAACDMYELGVCDRHPMDVELMSIQSIMWQYISVCYVLYNPDCDELSDASKIMLESAADFWTREAKRIFKKNGEAK